MNNDFDPHQRDDEMAHLDRGGDVAGWVRDPEPVRLADRVCFLSEKDAHGFEWYWIKIGDAEISVILWTAPETSRQIALTVASGPLSLYQKLSPEMARRVGKALLAAAEESEKGVLQ